MSRTHLNIGIAMCLVALAASLRVLPHPDNFAPITAVALFGGAVLPRRYALAVPLAAMIVTDLIIGPHDLVAVTWGVYALTAFAASVWLTKPSVFRVAGLALASSLVFFVGTNFAVWLTSGMYAHTLAGLQQCFTLAIPFFRNSLASDLLYTAMLFGFYALAVRSGDKVVSIQSERSQQA